MKNIFVVLFLFVSFNCFSTKFESTADGDWTGPNWTPSVLSNVLNGDSVYLNHYITISSTINLETVDLILFINDTLNITGDIASFLKLGGNSIIYLIGKIESDGLGNNNKIKIGTNLYSESFLVNLLPGSVLPTNPLPVELLYFDAIVKDNKVFLIWETASETNNEFFTIEKSKNGIDWNVLSYINANQHLRYKHIDYRLEKSYYRLSQTDFDGAIKYLKIRYVDYNSKSEEIIDTKFYDFNGREITEHYPYSKIIISITKNGAYAKKISK